MDYMFGLIIVLGIIGLFVGVDKLPKLFHNLGKATGEYAKGKNEALKMVEDIKNETK